MKKISALNFAGFAILLRDWAVSRERERRD
jgi:hypothetical protein